MSDPIDETILYWIGQGVTPAVAFEAIAGRQPIRRVSWSDVRAVAAAHEAATPIRGRPPAA